MVFFKDLRRMLTSGDNDKISSKRLITFLAFLVIAISYFIDLFTDYEINENMFNGLIQTVWAGLGVVVGEHLLKNKNSDSSNNSEKNDYNSPEEQEYGDN